MSFPSEAATLIQSHPIASYLIAISAITFVQFGWDKFKARRGQWRTPEATLLGLCLAGGSIGGGTAIWIFRHKCSKASFMRSYYAIVTLQVIGLIALFALKLCNANHT